MFNRKCAQFKKLDTLEKKKNALDSMKSLQKRVLTIYRAGGFSKKYAYKFHPESIKLANTSSNQNDVIGIVWEDLSNTMVCHIANQTPNNHWTSEKIEIGLKEVNKRGLDCLESKPTSPSKPAEKIMQASAGAETCKNGLGLTLAGEGDNRAPKLLCCYQT